MSLVISAPTPAHGRSLERRASYANAPAGSRAASATPGSGPVRLTMRGRLVIFAGPLLLALLIVAAGWLATSAVATDVTTGGATTEVVVQPGETLWQVAEEAVPSVDPRETVAVIMELNDLSSASVQAGQSLLVPVG